MIYDQGSDQMGGMRFDMRNNTFNKRLATLEAKAKPRVISTWVDFMMCEDDEVELSPELQELLVEITTNEEVEGSRRSLNFSHESRNVPRKRDPLNVAFNVNFASI